MRISLPVSPLAVIQRVGDTGLFHGEITGGGGLVSCERRDIAVVCDRVADLRRLQSRSCGLSALTGGVLALMGATLADRLAGLMLLQVAAGRKT